MEVDRAGLELLSSEECMRLLGTATLGRLALNVAALPVVVPVAFYLTDDAIVVRAGRGTDLEAATRDAVVGFEADAIDPDTGAGWSVVVTGVATHVDDVDPTRRTWLRSALGRWAGPRPDCFIRVSLGLVAGRRCSPRGDDGHSPLDGGAGLRP